MMVRTFISIPVKDTSALQSAVSDIKAAGDIRIPPMKQVHMTLKFIGDVDERKLPKVVNAVRKACEGRQPFQMELKGLGCFPNRKRPSVVWVGADPENVLTDLADSIGRELSVAGIKFDDKPFKSHITVGRCRGPVDIDGLLDSYRDTVFCTMTCDHVNVMKSVLSPQGARHSVIETVQLD